MKLLGPPEPERISGWQVVRTVVIAAIVASLLTGGAWLVAHYYVAAWLIR